MSGSVCLMPNVVVVFDSLKCLWEIEAGIGEGIEKLWGCMWIGSKGKVFRNRELIYTHTVKTSTDQQLQGDDGKDS